MLPSSSSAIHAPLSMQPQNKSEKTPSLKARASTCRRFSGTLSTWVASPNSVSADLHGGALGSHKASIDQRLRASFCGGVRGGFNSSLGFSRYNGYRGPSLKTVVVRNSDRA